MADKSLKVLQNRGEKTELSFLDLPTELSIKILSYCSIFDLFSVAMTCKKLKECAESQYIWKKKWTVLSTKSGLRFSEFPLNIKYKDSCRRLWKVCFCGQNLPSCIHCKNVTCLDSCLSNWERKIVIDIGSKITWLLTTTFSMNRHPTVVAIPKFAFTCTCSGKTSSSEDKELKCSGSKHLLNVNENQRVCKDNKSNYGPSAQSPSKNVLAMASMLKPVCILCNPETADQTFTNWKHWRNMNCNSKNGSCEEHACKLYSDRCSFDKSTNTSSSERFSSCKKTNSQNTNGDSNSSPTQRTNLDCLYTRTHDSHVGLQPTTICGWQSSLFSDVIGYLFGDLGDWQMVSPLDCFNGVVDMQTLRFYFEHILSQYNMLQEIRKPNVTFVICEPATCSTDMRKKIATMLFEKLHISRLCFLNKAVAVSHLIGQETCLVVDSGANNTVVTLVVDGQACVDGSQHIAIGGVAVAQYLAQAIEWNGIMQNVALSSLDTSQVKSNCHLSYNLKTEERRKVPIKQNIYVRSRSKETGPLTKLQKIELGAELYLAPEMMYASMGLPEMIKESIEGLSNNLAKQALSHIILTGSLNKMDSCKESEESGEFNGSRNNHMSVLSTPYFCGVESLAFTVSLLNTWRAITPVINTSDSIEGGNTELKGFSNRLMKDLRTLLPEYSGIINVHSYAGSRSWDVVMGAARLQMPVPCSQEINHSIGSPVWISREAYIIHGADILH